jgi:hypothetical protein
LFFGCAPEMTTPLYHEELSFPFLGAQLGFPFQLGLWLLLSSL